jgi:hypothetical protein
MCIEAVDKLSRLWDISDPEDRRGLAHSLFDTIVYDLDSQRITDFHLKPWADRFLMARADLVDPGSSVDPEGGEENGERGENIEEQNSPSRAGYGYAPKESCLEHLLGTSSPY